MSKKNLNNRLETLFTSLNGHEEESTNQGQIPVQETSVNWTWETDQNGVYCTSSKEVSKILGFSEKEVIGQPFFSFGLGLTEQRSIRSIFDTDEFPVERLLTYLSKNNRSVKLRVTILKRFDDDGKQIGYSGFSQPLVEVEEELLTEILVEDPNIENDKNADTFTESNSTLITEAEEISKEKDQDDSGTDPAETLPLNRDEKEDIEFGVQTGILPALEDVDLKAKKSSRRKKTATSKAREVKPKEIIAPVKVVDFTKLAKTAPLGPLPPIVPASSISGRQIFPTNLAGVSLIDNKFHNAENVWTQQGVISYTEDQLISLPAENESPAIMASPLKLGDQKTGVLEIVDLQPNRKWTEEDRLLVKEISTQLGLALENAQLYSTVQKELADRVKAEEETQKRNKDLAQLNRSIQQLTRLVGRDEIYEIISETVREIISTDNLLLAIFHKEDNLLTFPICLEDGAKVEVNNRPARNGYQEFVLRSKKTMLVKDNVSSALSEPSIDHPKGIPLSLLAVPLLIGDRSLGVISVFDFQKENAFDEIQSEILSAVAAQSATALENASLFQEIRQALETIEIRERYQSNVTNAVASLSEKGAISVDFLLESFARASHCERVYFSKVEEDSKDGTYWKVASLYSSIESNLDINNKPLDKMPTRVFPNMVNQLNEQGWYFTTLENAEEPERSYLEIQGVQSILALSIKQEKDIPSIIALENHSSSHEWRMEEIDILRIASDAFSNTLVREDLLIQIQNSLDETENLYTASHKLALANDMQEMISAIVLGIHVPAINRGVLVLFDYDPSGQITKLSVEANYFSGVGTPPPPVGTEYLKSLYQNIFVIPNPVFYDDLLEAQIEKTLQDILTRQNIRSMAILPLWSGNRQVGVFLIQSAQKHRFSSQEMRSYPPLVDQMSTAIENLRLFERTQAALAETELLYKISSGISRSSNMEEFVKLIGENVMPANADTLWLLATSQDANANSGDFEVIGSYNVQGEYKSSNEKFHKEAFDFVNFANAEPTLILDLSKSELPPQIQTSFKNMNLSTASFIPLQTTGSPIGIIIAGSRRISEFDSDDLHTLQIVGNSIAVAMERQRLLFEAQRRALELQTAAEIARDTTSTLTFDILLNRIVNLLSERFNYYHCSIFLLDESDMYAIIQEATGGPGLEMKRRRHKLAVGSKSVIGKCTASAEPVMVNDVTRSPIYYPNPLLPETRSELGLPMKISGRVIGAIDLQSTEVNAFSEMDLPVLQILTDQIAVAIENARAYEISQQAVEEMRELDRVKSQFLANMSHELRTPLNSVIGFSRVILKGIDGPINDVQEQDITAIYNSGMHLLNMINEILDLSKIEAGRMELQLEDVNLSDVINAAVTTATGLVKDKPIEIIQKIPANLPTLKADEIRIGQVVINLISNAVKFTDKGSITIEASLQKDARNNTEVLVTVTDTGMGIAVEDQSKLFQRFSQVDDSPTRKTGGTGLGLSICRSLIELHGGKIGLLSSDVGKGSVFFFTLPSPESDKGMDIEQLTHGEKVILSIDDDPQVIALYERFLRTHGYEVIPLTDPLMAVERARELQPFAITLDIMMPQKDGWQVLRDLKKDEDTRNIPIMICSILEEEEKGFNLGASEYLVKPFLQDDLTNAIKRMDKEGNIREVLIVDDDLDDLRLAQIMVEEEGKFHATLAEGGSAAIELLKTLTPDVIILDLFMPEMNGFELLEYIKADSRLNRVPVIILTGADLKSDQQTQLADYGSHLLTKGVLKENELLRNLEETLSKIKPTHLVN